MPIYEYECTKCGHRFERMQKMSDAPVKRCPECRSKVERLISSPAIRFKGSGWYVTDYSDKGKKIQKEAEKDKPATEGKGESSAGDKKESGKAAGTDGSKSASGDKAKSKGSSEGSG